MQLFADVTTLSPAGLIVGSGLALGAIAAAVWLMLRQRKASGVADGAAILDPLTGDAHWRGLTAFFLAADGVLMLVALYLSIRPAEHPRLFVLAWLQVLVLTMLLLGIAAFDMFVVRRRVLQEKVRMFNQNREEIRQEIAERTGHHRNGNAKSPRI